MPAHTHPHHHQHRRKRKGEVAKGRIKLLDKAVVVFGFLNVFATLPQVLTIYTHQAASGVSAFSWGYYTLFSALLLIYGFVHKEKPIIITYLGSSILYMLIFIGSLLYS